MKPLQVEIWSDIACPWCWVGKRHLEQALERFEHPVQVSWRSFELDPSAPKQADPDVDYVQRLADKYGASPQQAQAMIDRMTGVGTSVGLQFRFDIARPGNTFDAHRLLHFAARCGKQTQLKERLFLAYMSQGRSIAEPETLVELAADVGLDADRVAAVLHTDEFAAQVRGEQALARQLGITGVPFFVLGQRFAVQGAQPPEVLLQALAQAWDAVGEGGVQTDESLACGADGCDVPSG